MNFIHDSYVGLYFFSAVFQGNMALLAIVGVFAVFKYQSLQNTLQSIEGRLTDFVHDYIKHFIPGEQLYLDYSTLQSLTSSLDTLAKKYPSQADVADYVRHLDKLPFYSRSLVQRAQVVAMITDISKSVRKPLIATLTVVIISLGLLPISQSIHATDPFILEEGIIIAVVLINLYALFQNTMFVFDVLRQS